MSSHYDPRTDRTRYVLRYVDGQWCIYDKKIRGIIEGYGSKQAAWYFTTWHRRFEHDNPGRPH